MRVMVVDPDDLFAKDVAEHLTQEGFEVVCASSPDQMQAHLRMRSFDTVLIDLSLRRMNGFDVARELRMEHPASELSILVMSPRHRPDAPEIEALKRDIESPFFFEKPLEIPALCAAIRTPRPGPKKPPVSVPVGTPPPVSVPKPSPKPKAASTRKREVEWENIRDLTQIWTNKRTGTLVLAGDKSGVASIVEGGLVNDAAIKTVKQAVFGGVLAFKETSVDGVGDWARMGKLLFKGARLGTDSRTLRRYTTAVLLPNEHTALARSLPLSEDGRSFVGRVNGSDTVARLLDSGGYPLGDVSRDITALVQMGLFELQGTSAPEHVPNIKTSPEAARSGTVQGMGLAQVREANQSEDPTHLLRRLKKELSTIQDALPPVVLGVPADAERALVDKAGARMRQRYAELIARKDVSADVRTLALEIAKKVDAAHRHFNFEQLDRTGSSAPARISVHDEVDQMLEGGRALIETKRWAEADKLLSKAHEKRIDHVAVLANLGWARLHNPEQSLESRTDEGRDFLLLAEQFDPTNGEGQYYLAQVLVASSRLDAAEQRAERAAKADPGDTARAALLRKIRVLRAQEVANSR